MDTNTLLSLLRKANKGETVQFDIARLPTGEDRVDIESWIVSRTNRSFLIRLEGTTVYVTFGDDPR